MELDRRPLNEALEELMDRTGASIVLDPRTGEKSKMQVSAVLNNVSLEVAVRVLADLADLKPMVWDNVLYVTTKENARELQSEHDLRNSLKAKFPDKPEKPPAESKSK